MMKTLHPSRMTRLGVVGAALGLFGALASVHCSSTATTAGCKQLSQTIKPGVSVPCLCASGETQSKLCQEDNTWAECAPCAAKVACPDGLEPGGSTSCECPDGTPATQECTSDGNLGECGPCEPGTFTDAGKKDGGVCNNDGTPDPGEACDDGNSTETDDCTSNCAVTVAPAANACPGQPVTVWDATGATVSGKTDGYTSKHTASAKCGDGPSTAGNSPDRVYAVKVMKDSVALDVSILDANFEHSLWVNSDCAKPTTQLACADTGQHTGVAKEALSVSNVKAGTTYYVWVDGETNSSGTYKIKFRLR